MPGVVDDLLGGSDDVALGGVTVGLAVVDVDELEACVDTRLGGFDAGTMVEVDIDLDAIFGAVVVDHRANVGQADHRDLVVADLDQDGRLLGSGGADDRQQRLLVVDIEGADCEVLTTRATHQLPGSLDVRSGRRRHRSILSFAVVMARA
jgi:hypothetical protein